LVRQGHQLDVHVVINRNAIGLQCVEGIELILSEMHRSKGRSSPGFGQRQTQPHNQDPWKQGAVEGGGFGIEHVGQNNVDTPLNEAAREVAGIFNADALLQTSLVAFPRGGMACDHELTDVVDIDDCSSTQWLDQPVGSRTLAGCWASGKQQR
jgi:hypothetical protein